METINIREKERIEEEILAIFAKSDTITRKRAVRYFVALSEDIHIKYKEIENSKVSNAEIKLLIQEMHSGFAAMDKKFEAVDKRFEEMMHYMDKRFEEMMHYMDKRFEAVDKRFEEMMHYMDNRFGDVNNRFDDMNKRFNGMQWLIGLGFTLLTILLSIFSYFILISK